MPGPPPKRSEERRRRNKDAVEVTKVDLDSLIAGEMEIPVPPTTVDEETGGIIDVWEPQAMLLWESVSRSGQAIFMEPSDWAILYMLCEQLHRNLVPRPVVIGESNGEPVIQYMRTPMPGATLNAIMKGAGDLMLSEGARRKVRIELERKKQNEAAAEGKVVNIVARRADAFKGA